MLKREPNGGGELSDVGKARAYLDDLQQWKDQRDALIRAQTDLRNQLDQATSRATTLAGWVSTLTAALQATAQNASTLASTNTTISSSTASIAALDGDIGDSAQAHEIATARLLGGPPTAVPLVLLPLRLETSWDAATLRLRIYPDVLNVDSHEPRLTPGERSAGAAFWRLRADHPKAAADIDQAWGQLVRNVGAQRAAWIVHATDPKGSAPSTRNITFDIAVVARLLPDRFAVVALSGGDPVNLAGPGTPPRFVTWTNPVQRDGLPLGLLDAPGAASWLSDFSTAVTAGMAVAISVPAGAPPIETLLVVGLRGEDTPDLAGLLSAHAYTDGAEVLADGAPTNNSGQINSAHSRERESSVARALIEAPPAPAPADGSAGAQLADTLGIPRAALTRIAGAHRPRADAARAMAVIVGNGTRGALAGRLGDRATWLLASPAGPAPALRVGRQPYGVLPVSAPVRWRAQTAETGVPLESALTAWGTSVGPQSNIDPLNPPQHPDSGPARRITRDDDSQLVQLLVEAASSIAYLTDGSSVGGADGIVGPASGDQSAAAALQRLASTTPAGLHSINPPLPTNLLMQVALAAKQSAAVLPTAQSAAEVSKVDAALHDLATLAATPSGREDMLRLLTESLDAASHRFDAWVSGVVTERLTNLRAAAPTSRVGAYGWLTDVHARGDARSHGHILAPSLGHAATAAVLRSGFLGQRRRAYSQRVIEAQAAAAAAQNQLDQAEARLQNFLSGPPLPDFGRLLADAQRAVQQATQARDAAQGALAGLKAAVQQLPPLDGATEADLPLSVDLSSTRVRAGRRTLQAVRAGQPLAAVLGYQFERDLAAAALQGFLAPFRKLTRFHTGTALEKLEDARRSAEQALAVAQSRLASLQADVTVADQGRATANAALQTANATLAQAAAVAAPWHALRDEASHIDLAADRRAIAAAGPRPQPATRAVNRTVPVIVGGRVDRGTATIELRDPEDPVNATAWQKHVTELEQQLADDQARLDQINAALNAPTALAQLAEETAEQAAVSTANSGVQSAQERFDTASQAAASFAANDLQRAQAGVDVATRAIADALAALLASSQASTALTATVDGVALRERYLAAQAKSPPLWDHTTIPFPATATTPLADPELSFPVVGSSNYTALRAVLDQLDAHVDTVADLITAESVHQLVQGNTVRSGAALDIAASGTVPDDLDVLRTPRPGYDTTHRLLVAIDPHLEPAWTLPSSDAGSVGDPVLSAWISHHLPDPTHSQVTVRRRDPTTGQDGQPVTVRAADVTLDPLTWIRLAADPGALQQHVAHVARTRWAGSIGSAAATGRGIIDAPPGPFPELVAAAAAVRGLLTPSRALAASDLTPAPGSATTAPPSVAEVAEVVTRVQNAEKLVSSRLDALTKAAAGSDVKAVIDALLAASDLGETAATPDLIDGTPALDSLRAQGNAAAARLRTRLSAGPFAADATDPLATLARARERLRVLTGMALPGLIAVAVPTGAHLREDLAAKPTRLAHASAAEVRGWLADRARVRPAIHAFLSAYEVVETLVPGGSHLDVRATQAPDGDGAPPSWVGLQATPPAGGLNAVVQRSVPDPLPDAIVGLFIDEWNEVIPIQTHTPALAFHYDQPNSTPAQAILLAVAPDLSATRQPSIWDLDTLIDTLTSTLALARDRAVAAEAHADARVTIPDSP